MSMHLGTIKDWVTRAAEAVYCVNTLARRNGVSPRTLHRHFVETFKTTPHVWLHEQRMKRAAELLMDASKVKETAYRLGYKHPSHFTRDFRQYHGYPPGQHVQRVLKATTQPS